MNVLMSMYGAKVLRSRIWMPAHTFSQARSFAKKVKRSSQAVVELDEGEKEIINLNKVENSMSAAVNALKHEYTSSITSRITPASLDKLSVQVEGHTYSLRQIAQLGMPNPQTIVINMSAYPESMNSVASAIRAANLNLNPLLDKNIIRVPIPKMTGELRESLAKLAKTHAEKAKVGVRKAKQKGVGDLKKQTSVSEDSVHRLEKYLQQMADKHIKSIDKMLEAKSTELKSS